MIEMARYQGYVDIAAFPYGLAVVQGLENCQYAGVLLHQPRQRIKVFGAFMTGAAGPPGKSCRSGLHRGIDIVFPRSRYGTQFFARRGVATGDPSCGRQWLTPLAIDKKPKPAPIGGGGIGFPRGHILHDYIEARVMPSITGPIGRGDLQYATMWKSAQRLTHKPVEFGTVTPELVAFAVQDFYYKSSFRFGTETLPRVWLDPSLKV